MRAIYHRGWILPAVPVPDLRGVQPLRRPVALDYNWDGSTLIENYSLLDPAVAAFVCIPALLLAALVAGTNSAWRRSGSTSSQAARAAAVVGVLAAAWMGVSWRLAATGVLQQWDRVPPPFGLLLVSMVALAVLIVLSPLGVRMANTIPLWMLVGVQAFRLPLELAMHAMAERGVMPAQMTYTGRNFDIVTGAAAIVVAALLLAGRAGRPLVLAWNILGFALLLNVIIVAIVSTPIFRMFGDDQLNVFVTYTPFVWLPTVMVLAALAGHLLVFRALRARE